MHRLCVVSDTAKSDALRTDLAGVFDVQFLSFDRVRDHEPDPFTVVDIGLRETSRLVEIKEWLQRKPRDGKAVFVIDKASRIEVTQAYAVGATHVVPRPLNGKELLRTLFGEFAALAGNAKTFPVQNAPGVAAALETLQNIFSAACLGQAIDPAAVNSAGDAVVGQLDAQGLESWIETVRKHHSQTYQHCMLVTGLAVGFGQNIGLSFADRRRLSIAGMLHDVGKARIPLAILEKPGPLDQDELAVMRRHPELGVSALGTEAGLAPEMIDMVLHHHEMLDGSGYPHALQANDIADLVRIMTIADIFGALIEKRSYKPPLSNEKAYQILIDMGPKLDKDLVRAFKSTAQFDQRRKAG
jgi:putative nucleotidyltransferase with HDIG domain